jgi:putative Holliday junction resolvase
MLSLQRIMGRIVAIDYGQKRTGIAVTDPMHLIANGLDTVLSAQAVDFLKRYASVEPVDVFVVGYPRDMSYRPSEAAPLIEQFVNDLHAAVPSVPVQYVDERFTSKIARQSILAGGATKKQRRNKALIDKISALIILETYLESKQLSL